MMEETFVITLSCANTAGIVSSVAGWLFEHGCNILDAQQFDDQQSHQFFMRVAFNATDMSRFPGASTLKDDFQRIAKQFQMTWKWRAESDRKRVMILVSKFDHCLNDLLYRWRVGDLRMDITAVVSNHPRNLYTASELDTIPFHHLPITATTKTTQEARLRDLVQSTKTDLVVLARYMQILSDETAQRLRGRCINIHHSFLPGFKGAKPYHQAHVRGVKLIGATSHFVTSDLDEGPIIDQDVERITHRDTPEALVRKGRDIERRVLARAVGYYLDDRILLNDGKTVIFGD